MAATRTALKQYFKKYATPTEEQFAALIDAFVHKDEDSLTQSKIDGLTAALESKVSSSDLASAVATAVEETLQGGNIEVTPAAHQHAIADVEGLQAFVTKVNNFLESADVSDETINRWAEIETFLTGITDQETLTGLLLNLKNEILAQIPQPQTGNYLKQISDLDAYTEAQEGEIVQYVGSTTENYRRGFCYERVVTETATEIIDYYKLTNIQSDGYPVQPYYDPWTVFSGPNYKAHKTNLVVTLIGNTTAAIFEGTQNGSLGWRNNGDVWVVVQTEDLGDSIKVWFGQTADTGLSSCWQDTIPKTTFTLPVWQENDSGRYFIVHNMPQAITLDNDLNPEHGVRFDDLSQSDFTYTTETETTISWQPIATSPVVS